MEKLEITGLRQQLGGAKSECDDVKDNALENQRHCGGGFEKEEWLLCILQWRQPMRLVEFKTSRKTDHHEPGELRLLGPRSPRKSPFDIVKGARFEYRLNSTRISNVVFTPHISFLGRKSYWHPKESTGRKIEYKLMWLPAQSVGDGIPLSFPRWKSYNFLFWGQRQSSPISLRHFHRTRHSLSAYSQDPFYLFHHSSAADAESPTNIFYSGFFLRLASFVFCKNKHFSAAAEYDPFGLEPPNVGLATLWRPFLISRPLSTNG